MKNSILSSIVVRSARAAKTFRGSSITLIVILLLVGGLIIVDMPRPSDDDAIHQAAANGDVDALRGLIAQGGDPNARDGLGYTPLAWAALLGRIDTVEMLLDAGAAVDLPHPQLGSPLMLALANGHANLARCLLMRGADVHLRCAGWDPVGSAVRSNSLECLELALEAGGRLQLGGRRCGLLTLASFDSDTRLLKRLLEAGVDPNVPDEDGSTPLINAIECGATESARLLLRAGADPYRADADGRTPRAVAQQRGCLELFAPRTFEGADGVLSSVRAP